MTSKRSHAEYTHRKELQDCGWRVQKRDAVAFNSGSETVRHQVCKLLVASYLKEQGWRIDTEVKKDSAGEIDILAYGRDEAAIAVEVETGWTEDTLSDKVDRYVRNEPIRDVFPIEVNDMPDSIMDAQAWIAEELDGL